MRALASIAVATWLAACAPVNAWEKGHLAKPAMQFDLDHEMRSMQRVYSSKEGASGGYGVGGGGCGCN